MDSELSFALELAELADSITLPRFRATDLAVEIKPDLTPVSEADRAVEEALRRRIAEERPGDGVLGEELGGLSGDRRRRWIIDPIDGTRNYVRGIPVYATLLALEVEGELVLGVASAPALGRRWWAARGEGAFADGQAIRVSGVRRIEDAVFAYTSVRDFYDRGARDAFLELAHRAWAARGFGDFWQYVLLAEGAVDVAAEAVADLWDLAAVKLIVEEAGGRFTDLTGADRADGGTALASNGLLHDEALAAFRPWA